MTTLSEVMAKYRDTMLDEAWDTEMHTAKKDKGMFKGKGKDEIKSALDKKTAEAAKLRRKGKPEPASMKKKIKQEEFALRAKNNFGKVEESIPGLDLFSMLNGHILGMAGVVGASLGSLVGAILINLGGDKSIVNKIMNWMDSKKQRKVHREFLLRQLNLAEKRLTKLKSQKARERAQLTIDYARKELNNDTKNNFGKVEESVLKESAHHALEAILQKYPKDVDEFIEDGLDNCSQEFNDALYEYYVEDMPYGVAKARTGDPSQWISEHLFKYLSDEGLLPDDEIVDPDPLMGGGPLDSYPLGEGKTQRKCKGKGCDKKCPDGKNYCSKKCQGNTINLKKEVPINKKLKESIPGPFSKNGVVAKELAEGKDKKKNELNVCNGCKAKRGIVSGTGLCSSCYDKKKKDKK